MIKQIEVRCSSGFAEQIQAFISEKRGLGYSYNSECYRLGLFDRFILENGFQDNFVTKEIFNKWSVLRPNEGETNRILRIGSLQRFSRFLQRMGYPSYVLPHYYWHGGDFKAFIFTDDEITRLLKAAKEMKLRSGGSKSRCFITPMLFTLIDCQVKCNDFR